MGIRFPFQARVYVWELSNVYLRDAKDVYRVRNDCLGLMIPRKKKPSKNLISAVDDLNAQSKGGCKRKGEKRW